MELFFIISSNIFVILFLIASLIILMIVFDKLRTRFVGCRKISPFFGLCSCFSFVGSEQQSANKRYLPGELMWIGSGKRAQKNGIKKYKSDTEAMFVNHRNLLLWISLDK